MGEWQGRIIQEISKDCLDQNVRSIEAIAESVGVEPVDVTILLTAVADQTDSVNICNHIERMLTVNKEAKQ